ncbi:hypothetical protein BDV12DRAFT_197417 [Aspergillus spectabilis]
MSSIFSRHDVLSALYAGNGLWHTSALIHFAFRQNLMMRKLSTRKSSSDATVSSLAQGDKWHHDIMAYLGGINSAPALLAFLRLWAIWKTPRFLSTGTEKGDLRLDIIALLVLGLANFSQAFLNFTIARTSGRWIMGRGWDRITVLDALFTGLDWGAAVANIRLVSTSSSDLHHPDYLRPSKIRLKLNLHALIFRHGHEPDMMDSHRLTVLEDQSAFDGATTFTIRDHFKRRVGTEPEIGQGAGARRRQSQRYRYCIQVDEEVLDMVVNKSPAPEVSRYSEEVDYVKLINEWEPYDPVEYEDEFDRLVEEPEERLEGCSFMMSVG